MGSAGAGPAAAARGSLAAELCAPLLLLCWLCCWPDDASSDSTSGKYSVRTAHAHAHAHESGSRRRSSEVFGRRVASSVASLHLPGTSGYKKPLSAHRSHEEIGVRRKSGQEARSPEARYHSAPSVIDEVLHRRDWERSTHDLHIPLRSPSSGGPEAPHATPESSSIDAKSDEQLAKTCKKHHTNIKSSRGKKEKESTDIKDDDATEASSFYIGEYNGEGSPINNNVENKCEDVHTKSIYKAKDDKQSFNESIRSKERPQGLAPVAELRPQGLGFCLDDVIEQLDRLEPLDRSGATHHTMESRLSLSRHMFPPPSVEPVSYEGAACYLREGDACYLREGDACYLREGDACYLREGDACYLREGDACYPREGGPYCPREAAAAGLRPRWAARARHASDGDILGPLHRPESGAFSESDLDLELEGTEERPPSYEELQQYAAHDHKETAI